MEWGLLVAIEGIDGSGTTTFSRTLYEKLSEFFSKVALTHEPTESLLGLVARSILQGDVSESYERSDLLAYLFTADRIYHFYEKPMLGLKGGILSLLKNGFIVVTDRYKYSTIVYQSLARKGIDDLPMDFLFEMNSVVPPPHVLIFLDVKPETALKRILGRESVSSDERLFRLRILREKFLKVIDMVAKDRDGLWKRKIPEADSFMPNEFPLVLKIKNENERDLEEGIKKAVNLVVGLSRGEPSS